MAVTASGRWIVVAMDGREVLRYCDLVEPMLAGKVGLAVRESRCASATCGDAPAGGIAAAPPVHQADFHLRQWVGRHYIFDGDEPIGHIAKERLAPGDEARAGADAHGSPTAPGAAGAICDGRSRSRCRSSRRAGRSGCTVDLDDQDGRCTGTGDWTLAYDPNRGYVWDLRAAVRVLVDGKVKKWDLNIADPCFYQTVAPATGKMPAGRRADNFAVYTRADGRLGWFPANHQFKNGGASARELHIRRGGFFGTTVDDWAAVVEVPEDNEFQYAGDYCAWGLDQHVYPIIDPALPQGNLRPNMLAQRGDVYTGHARFYAFGPERVRQILKEGICARPEPGLPAELAAHVEPVNHFDDIVPAVAGDSKIRWLGDYTIDRRVGRGDLFSLRISADGKKLRTARLDQLGPSFRSGPYLAAKYRVGCWVKAEQFAGSVALKVDGVVFPVKREFHNPQATLNIADHCDWTWLGFESDFLRSAHFWNMAIVVQGQGVVWVDDFEITPLETQK